MTDDLPPPELFVPKPGITVWRVLDFLQRNPEEYLTRKDISVKFDCALASVLTLMQIAVSRGCLKKSRGDGVELQWTLGDPSTFRLDPLPGQVKQFTAPATPSAAKAASIASAHIVQQLAPKSSSNETVLTTSGPETVAAPAPQPAPAEHQAVKVVQPLVLGSSETVTGDQEKLHVELPVKKVRAGVAENPWPLIDTKNPPPPAEPKARPVRIEMPLHLTPELIEAVRKDPRTSFEDKADSHHAIGWLHDAYRVMVETQRNQPVAQ